MFSVALLARETPEALNRLLEHYSRLGAEQLFLYQDCTSAVSRRTSFRVGKMHVKRYDIGIDFWTEEIGQVPTDFQARQRIIYEKAISENESDWIFLCDADEFIIDGSDLFEALAAVPENIASVRIPTAEAVWVNASDSLIDKQFSSMHFRRPLAPMAWRLQRRLLYGGASRFLQFGILGHIIGKQFLRRGAEYSRITSHLAYLGDQCITYPLHQVVKLERRIQLAHYDAVSFPRWLEKFRRRIDGEIIQGRTSARRAQQEALAYILTAGYQDSPSNVRRLFRELYCINSLQYRILKMQGKAFRFEVK